MRATCNTTLTLLAQPYSTFTITKMYSNTQPWWLRDFQWSNEMHQMVSKVQYSNFFAIISSLNNLLIVAIHFGYSSHSTGKDVSYLYYKLKSNSNRIIY